MMDGLLWGLVIIGGPLLLGLAMFLFGERRRRLTRAKKTVSEQAARDNWGKEEIH
jgi:hypothetical protein